MKRAWIAAAGLIVAAGCADIDAARRAQDPASAAPGERTVTAKEVGLAGDALLSLDRGLEIALASNPSLASSRARAGTAAERVTQAHAALLPQVSLSANYRGSKSSGGDDDDVLGLTHSQGAGLSVSQLLYDFGQADALGRQAADGYLAALADLRDAENTVALDFRTAFFNVLKQQELIRVAEETVRQFEKRLEQVTGFVEVGTRVRYDLTKAQVDLGNARLALVRARTALVVDRATLNNVLGLAEETTFRLAESSLPEEGLAVFADLAARARENHPALAAATLRERASSATIDAAIADAFPGLTLQGGFSLSGSLTPISWTTFLSPVANWLAYGGGIKDSRIREAVTNLRDARSARAREEQKIFLDLRRASAEREDARQRLEIASLTVKQAEENNTLVLGRYAAGKASSVELTDAQVALANARGDRIQAQFDQQIAVATLKRAVGTVR